jgi:hypothetical protein
MGLEIAIASITLVTKLLDMAKGFKGSEILEQNLKLLRDQLQIQAEAHAKAEGSLREAEKKVSDLEFQAAKDFIRFNGNLFRILPSGKLDFAVYCERCRISVGISTGYCRCHTPDCKWMSNIPGPKLGEALKIVAAEYRLEISEPLFEQPEPLPRQIISHGYRPNRDRLEGW